MNLAHCSFPSRHAIPVLWLCLLSLACCPPAAHATRASREAGLRLLQAQLPVGGSLRRLDCEHLARAVRAATLTHRREGVAILSAALTLDEWDARRQVEERLSCPCVSQLFQAAVSAAPDAAAALLQTAEALHPDCADALTAALRGLAASNQVAVVSRDASPGDASPDGSAAGTNANGAALTSPDGSATSAGPAGGLNGSGNFGLGLGAGFPGAPGFSGSAGGSGGFPLPTPVPVTVTAVVNP